MLVQRIRALADKMDETMRKIINKILPAKMRKETAVIPVVKLSGAIMAKLAAGFAKIIAVIMGF